MKKRLRKKLHLKEFSVFSFEVGILPIDGLTKERMKRFSERIIEWGLNSPINFFLGFGYTTDQNGLVRTVCSSLACRWNKNLTMKEEHRFFISSYLKAQPEVKKVWVGPMINSYYCRDWQPVIRTDDIDLPTNESV